jgi:hypothetical protein
MRRSMRPKVRRVMRKVVSAGKYRPKVRRAQGAGMGY